jgi:predicted nucleic acid-binding protein
MTAPPLLVFDTNILMDLLLGRDGANAVLLVKLAEQRRVELVVPEYVLLEFRGTALRWVREERERLGVVRRASNEWRRSQELDKPAEDIRSAAADVEARLKALQVEVDVVVARMRSVARVPSHTMEVHFRGDLRYLEGRPPDRPVDGLKDCRIYEAVLEVARAEVANPRLKFLVTRDADFDAKELVDELASLGFTIRKDPGGLYGQLR